MAANWKPAWPIVYDRKLVEAYLTLMGYVPVKRRDINDPFDYVGIRSTAPEFYHLVGNQGGLTWYTRLGPAWVDCEWGEITDATLHTMFGTWKAKYEP